MFLIINIYKYICAYMYILYRGVCLVPVTWEDHSALSATNPQDTVSVILGFRTSSVARLPLCTSYRLFTLYTHRQSTEWITTQFLSLLVLIRPYFLVS